MVRLCNARDKCGFGFLKGCISLVCTLAVMVILAAPLKSQSEWQPIFNGKDFTGWRGQPDLWSIENGVIVGRTDGKIPRNEFLSTVKKYRNFVLRLKVLLVKGEGNSGIQYRSEYNDGGVSGYQADLADGWWGVLYEENGRGILRKPDPQKLRVNRTGWNEYEIMADGDHLQTRLNGLVILDIRDTQATEGVFALQVHKGPPMEVRFKDLLVKELN